MHLIGQLVAQQTGRTYFDLARVHAMPEGWHWLVLVLVCLAVVAYVVFMYRRDSVELSRGLAISLTLLRIVGLCGILFWFLDLEKKTETRLVKNSRVHVLIDTSQSMGLRDSSSSSAPAGPSRMELIVDELTQGSLIGDLRKQHDVVFHRFDQANKPVELATLTKNSGAGSAESADERKVIERRDAFGAARVLTAVAGGLLLFAILAGLSQLALGNRVKGFEGQNYATLAGVIGLVAAAIAFSVANLRAPEAGPLALIGLQPPNFSVEDSSEDNAEQDGADGSSQPGAVDGADENADKDGDGEPDGPAADFEPVWADVLSPRGSATRIGDALRFVVDKERGGPIAGIVLVTDGRSNEGADPSAAVSAAQQAQIPVFVVGMGTDQRPANARIVDLEAPRRVYPGDAFTLTGYVQANGLAGRGAKLELYSADASDENGAESFEDERRITLPGEGSGGGDAGEESGLLTVKFEVTPESPGKRTYTLRITPPDQDHDIRDNEKSATVQIIERKNRVLLLAGGPMREYQFLRNMLFRDSERGTDDTTLDVLLQSATPGVSQEADNLLFDFPSSAAELFEYDCIVAFDPDWMKLSEEEVELLDRWVAEKAGGLVVIAGPVFTPQWAHTRRGDKRVDTIRSLYPVVFDSRGSSALTSSRFGGDTSWPIQFTRDGLESDFLRLEDDAIDSEAAWAEFDGVFGYYSVKDPKPGARVFARFGDPATSIDGESPVYMAGHFYGAGRVFFQASGEMWRLRAVDEGHFERYYTKLIRWASEGRLLRDSSRGVLLVDRDRALLGEQIVTRAIMTDEQHNPLMDDEVQAVLLAPDATRTPLVMRRDANSPREGMYRGQFPATQEGDYRIELEVLGSDEMLTRDVRIRVPEKEIQQPERNDVLLAEIARKTDGGYYIGMAAAAGRAGGGLPALATVLEPQDQITPLPGRPDKLFEKTLLTTLLGLICGAFCLEWLIRRLSKLA